MQVKVGHSIVYRCFNQLNVALTDCPALKLQNSLESPVAYAWIHCDTGGPCTDYFLRSISLDSMELSLEPVIKVDRKEIEQAMCLKSSTSYHLWQSQMLKCFFATMVILTELDISMMRAR